MRRRKSAAGKSGLLAAGAVLILAGAVLGTGGRGTAGAAAVDPCVRTSGSAVSSCKPGMDASLRPLGAAAGRHGREIDYRLLRDGHVPAPGSGATDPLTQAVAVKASLPIAGGVWSSQGPAPISYPDYTDTGRVLALAFQQSTGTLFLGSAGGGIWKSSNGGASWAPLTDSMPSLAVDALALDPNHDQTIYAGTGETAYCGGCLYGVGVYKSTDGGATWTLYGNSVFSRNVVSSIVIDPSNSTNVYAGVVNHTGGNLGVAVSTDGGVTWTDPAGTALTGHNVTDLAVDSAGRVYAAVSGAGAANGVYLSTDHGQTWTKVSTGLPSSTADQFRISLAPNTAANPVSGQVLYAVASDGQNSSYGKLLGVYRTTNGGASWTQIAPPSVAESWEGQAWYDIYIAVDPRDTTGNTVYFGLSAVYRTTTGLAASPSWTDLTCDKPGCGAVLYIHPDQHAVTFAGQATYFANDGGVYESASGGGQPFTAANGNLDLTQFYGGALGTGATSSRILGGTQDNGTVQTDGSGWSTPRGGDGMQTAIDYSQNQNMYGEFADGNTFATHDGTTWNQQTSGMDLSEAANWSAPLVMDPNSPQTLYSGHTHLYRTVNGENSWSNISASVTPSTAISAVAVPKSDPRTIYFADFNAHIWATHDGGATWTSLDAASCDPGHPNPYNCANGGITALAVDPTNSQILYATVNTFEGAQRYHIFKTTDGGATWSDISTALPDIPFQTVAVNPQQPSTVYAGANVGAYVSYDGGSTWNVLGTGLPNAPVYQLVPNADGSFLTAFTYGRGAWRVSTASISASPNPVPGGSTTSTITWHTGNASFGQVYVSVNGGTDTLFSQGSDGSGSAPWIYPGSTYVFKLFAGTGHSTQLGSASVTALAVPAISATPNPVPVGTSSTTISWSTGDGSTGQVYVSANGGSDNLLAQGPSGSTTVPWISAGSTFVFKLFAGTGHSTLLTSVTVNGPSPSLAASPNPLPVDSSTTKITWNSGDGSTAQVYVAANGGADVLLAQGSAGSASAPWISPGGSYVFKLYAGTAHATLLASVTVTRPAIAASPNPVPAGSSTSDISWATPDGSTGQVYVSVDGGADTLFAQGPSGTAAAPWINSASTYVFKLFAGTTHASEIASVTVT